MSTVTKPNTFSSNTTISSSQVNSNFDTIYNEFNGSISAANLATNAITTAKITDANVTTAKIADDAVTTAKILDSNVTNAKLALGVSVQTVYTSASAVATGTTVIPVDDTIPQNTEGDQYMTVAITPKSTTNILIIRVVAMLANSAASPYIVGALFQDTTANALAADLERAANASDPITFVLEYQMVAGTTSATTFKFRAGASGAGTTTFNGQVAGRFFGAIAKSSMVITEYKAA